MENKNNFYLAMEKIRKSPEIVFDYKDIRGVENAFRSMLDIFNAEALRGHGDEIEVYCFSDSYYAIRLKSDRCLDIGFEDGVNDRWIEVFNTFRPDDADYTEFLFGNAQKEAAEPGFDRVDKLPLLACNQFVSERMIARVKVPGAEKGRLIEFRHGKIYAFPCDCEADYEGTQIFFKYDSEVFDEITLSKAFLDAVLSEAAIANKGIKYTLKEGFDKYKVVFPIETYFYKDAAAYIEEASGGELLLPVLECRRTHTGCDNSVTGRVYTAQVDVSVGFTKNTSAVNCFYNGHRLSSGGEFLRSFYKEIQNRVKFIASQQHRNVPITVRQLKRHLIVNVDIRTTGCVPHWGDGQRRSLDNRMIADIVTDVCRNEIYKLLSADEVAVAEKLVDLIIEEESCEKETKTLMQTVENAAEDYENGDGKGGFVDCLLNAPRTPEGCDALISVMEREVCKEDMLYYYILFKDFAEFMKPSHYNRLRDICTSITGKSVPELFQ